MATVENDNTRNFHATTRPHQVLDLQAYPDMVISSVKPVITSRIALFRPDLLQESNAKRAVQVPIIFAGPIMALKEVVLKEIHTYERTLLQDLCSRENCRPFLKLDGCEVCRYTDKVLNEVETLGSCVAMLRTARSTEIIEVIREILNRYSSTLGFDLGPYAKIISKLDMCGETPQTRAVWLACDLKEFYDEYHQVIEFYKQRTEWRSDTTMNVVNFILTHSVLLFRDIVEKHFKWNRASVCDKLFFHKALVDKQIGDGLSRMLNTYCEILSPKLFYVKESDLEESPTFAEPEDAHAQAVEMKRKFMRFLIMLNDIRIFNKDILRETILGPDLKLEYLEFSQYHS